MFFLLSLLEAPADANCFGWWARCAMGQTMHLSDFMDVAADGYFSMSFNAEQGNGTKSYITEIDRA